MEFYTFSRAVLVHRIWKIKATRTRSRRNTDGMMSIPDKTHAQPICYDSRL
jgi:hypothetical protein